jgi:hypothetical protein
MCGVGADGHHREGHALAPAYLSEILSVQALSLILLVAFCLLSCILYKKHSVHNDGPASCSFSFFLCAIMRSPLLPSTTQAAPHHNQTTENLHVAPSDSPSAACVEEGLKLSPGNNSGEGSFRSNQVVPSPCASPRVPSPSPSLHAQTPPSPLIKRAHHALSAAMTATQEQIPPHVHRTISKALYQKLEENAECILLWILQLLMILSIAHAMMMMMTAQMHSSYTHNAAASEPEQDQIHQLFIPSTFLHLTPSSYTFLRENADLYLTLSSFCLYTMPYLSYSLFSLSPSTLSISMRCMISIYLFSFFFLSIFIIILQAYLSLMVLLLISLCFVCLLVDHQIQKVSLFLMHREKRREMEEQEQRHAQEWRHLIANVAHDLKTVSSLSLSFFACSM